MGVQSMAKEQIVGSTGFPAESHETVWLKLTVDQPIARCPMSGNVYQLEYIGLRMTTTTKCKYMMWCIFIVDVLHRNETTLQKKKKNPQKKKKKKKKKKK